MSRFPEGAAFVVGGSGGLGSAICEAFARHGVNLALTFCRNGLAANATKTAAVGLGVEAEAYRVDVANRSDIAQALRSAESRFGSIGTVIYAGGPHFVPSFFSEVPPETWESWLGQDVAGCINLAQEALPYLRRSAGSFLTLSTYQNNRIEPRGSVSSIAKAALDRMVVAIAREEGRHGVRANSIRVGWFDVRLNKQLFESNPGLREQKLKDIPLRRLGRAEELGETVVFLASRSAGFISGVNLTVDGAETT